MAVNNGRRLPVAFGTYAGQAGISEDWTEVAFPAGYRDFRDPIGGTLKVTAGTIDGKAFTVTDARRGETAPSMVVLTVAAVTPGDGE